MDLDLSFLTQKILLGNWVKQGVDWITDNFYDELRLFSDGLGWLIDGCVLVLMAVPPLVFIAAVAGIAYWRHRSVRMSIAVAAGLMLILNLGYWEETIQTIALVLWATVFSVTVGVPLGIAAAHRPWLYAAIRPVLDMMQTIPTFVYLIPTLILFGLGMVPGLISTVIFAIPAPIRLTYVGVSGVPRQLVEAGLAFGSTRRQLLLKIELPHATPMIMAGITQCIMLSLSMVVIAALVGAEGLGTPVVRALNTINVAKGFEAGLSIVIVAILLDRMLKRVDPTGPGGRT
jgi:glycine betaine/proline transport system permease protein